MTDRPSLFVRHYPRLSRLQDAQGMAEHRRRHLAPLADVPQASVLELGAGSGDDFAHYPPAVAHVLAVEPEPHLRALAEERALTAPVPVAVVGGHAGALPAADDSVDAVVATFVLCTVPDLARCLTEVRRVLRPGGTLLFLEHVRADTWALTGLQRALDATIWPRLVGGCHLARDTLGGLVDAGFEPVDVHAFRFPGPRTPTAFHVRGTARPQ